MRSGRPWAACPRLVDVAGPCAAGAVLVDLRACLPVAAAVVDDVAVRAEACRSPHCGRASSMNVAKVR